MIDVLAQTTQPAAWRSWGPAEWAILIGAITSAVTAILALLKSNRAETNSANANATARDARASADHAGNIASEARGVATTATPIPTMPLQPPVASPEAQARAFDAANETEKPPSC